MIPYGRHFVDADDVAAVTRVVEESSLTQGEQVELFEEELASYVGAKYAVATSSGTAALHLAYLTAGANADGNVITSPISFVATANAALYCGSDLIFVDIDYASVNIDPSKLSEVLRSDQCKNNKVNIVVPVHFGGLPCDMVKIANEARDTNCKIVEDASHALGGQYSTGESVGSCVYSDMTVFSFHPVKSIALGEGGAITTNDEQLYKRLLRLRSHGINKGEDQLIYESAGFTNGIKNPWYYEAQELGFNYRLTDIQCALGRSQLKKLPEFMRLRTDKSNLYDELLGDGLGIESFQTGFRGNSANHLYVLRIPFSEDKVTRTEFMHRLRAQNIGSQVHYIPIPHHPLYSRYRGDSLDITQAERYYGECLSIPLYPSLSDDEQLTVVEVLKSETKEFLK